MQVEVRIPVMLKRLTGNAGRVTARGNTIGEIINDLESRHAGIKAELISDGGQIHRFVNIYLNDEDVRFIDKLDTAVASGDTISILPAVAGGVL